LIIEVVIVLATEAYRLRNFPLLFAVHGALMADPIARLSQSWALVSPRLQVRHSNRLF
jgi:hypothetical protein